VEFAVRALLGLTLACAPVAVQAKEVILTCTNLSSGTAWDSKVDLDRHTVDSFPADISDRTISWADPQRIYEFDRRSGEMTMRGPSSTGGYFLYYRCREHN